MSKQKSKKHAKSLPVKSPPEQQQQLVTPDEDHVVEHRTFSCISLGTGSFSAAGVFSLTSSSLGRSPSPFSNSTEESVGSFSDDGDDTYSCEQDDNHTSHRLRDAAASKLSPIKEVFVSRMPSRVFIRTADLPHMKEAASQSRHSSFSDLAEEELEDYVHKPSSKSPLPDMEHDPNESWVALDDGNENKSPLAEAGKNQQLCRKLFARCNYLMDV